MEIVLTAWALDSYLDLKHQGVFTVEEYRKVIRPDVLLLKRYPPGSAQFKNRKFWGPAVDQSNRKIPHGFKMKWHQVGNGKVQLRLPVAVFTEAMICGAYVKKSAKQEKRKLEVFRTHVDLIRLGNYQDCGRLE